MNQITARNLLEAYRAVRRTDQEIALIEFMELSESERWELVFIGMVLTSHEVREALKRSQT